MFANPQLATLRALPDFIFTEAFRKVVPLLIFPLY